MGASPDRPGFKQTFPEEGKVSSDTVENPDTPAAPKRIVICCDGTWQSSVSGLKNVPSNVTRIARSLARSGKDENGTIWQQIVHYDAGIGTGDLSQSEQNRQGGFGIGFVANVIEAYNFIVNNYHAGDQIFCFGFSRGAYTARAVAGLVTDIGILSPRDMQDFPDLYTIYQKHERSFTFRDSKAYREWVHGVKAKEPLSYEADGTPKKSKQWIKPPHYDAPEASRVVQVVGVFDTVGSLGIPDLSWTKYNLKFLERVCGIPDPGFHNVSLSPYIRNAFHALALDERRSPFSPTLWHFPLQTDGITSPPNIPVATLQENWRKVHDDASSTEEQLSSAWKSLIRGQMVEQLKNIDSNLQQVWFPGHHINIGGGSDELLKDCKNDLEQIALITFAWMCEQVAPFLQFVGINGDLKTLAHNTFEDRYNLIRPALERISKVDSNPSGVLLKTLSTLVGGKKKSLVQGDLVNGWATGPVVDYYEGGMLLAGPAIRTPGDYKKDPDGKPAGRTEEYIHPSIWFRMDKDPKYRPAALKGFTRSTKMEGSKCVGYEWKKGSIVIPEYLIKSQDEFSRHLAKQDHDRADDQAWAFIGKIDVLVGAQTEEAADVTNSLSTSG